MQAVMLLAGEGTRMHPLTYTKPKPLLKIAGQTILEHNLENLKRNGIQDVTLVVGYLQEEIKRFLENAREFKFNFVLQNDQLGTGHALLQAKDFIKDDNFTVIYGDDLYHYEDIKKTLNNDLCVTAKEVTNPGKFGVFTLENNFVKDLIEKPDEPISNLANTGLYVLNKAIFKSLQALEKSKRNEFELTDAILHLSKENSIKCEITNNWIPIGYPWDLVTANEIKMRELDSITVHDTAFVGKNVTIEGSVKIGRNSEIKNGAYIEGPVMIGDNCVIGPNCYLRPDSVIGDNCRIGNGVEIKNTIVGDETKIKHLSYVGDSVIGDNCNLGAGTITANIRHDNKTIRVIVKGNKVDTGRRKFGVVMGDHTKTGVNTSIYP
ncbi:MAG: NTP transferase domain-containing protein, partial [Candidatus Aenigmarchaeota archaeon]|nr:NTP transferase domain-containing protein [Candidatus Aenigmarchaeota archaeon]